eukprot:gene30464-36820_t
MLSSPYALDTDASNTQEAVKTSNMYVDVLAGTLGGITVTVMGHPFDTTKTRLQTAPPGFYSGTMDCVKKTFHWEGLRGFYSGIVSPLSGQMLFRATSFTTYFNTVKLMQPSDQILPTASELFKAGAVTGLVISFIECPIDLLKTKLQVQIFKSRSHAKVVPRYRTVTECARYIVGNYGYSTLWRGLSATIIRNIPANALFFPVSEILKRHFAELDGVSVKDLSMDRYFLSGAAAGLSYWVTTYPLDVIKARMQCAPLRSHVTWLGTAQQLYASGWRAFTTGIVPCAARAIPACSMMFTTVDLVRNYLN